MLRINDETWFKNKYEVDDVTFHDEANNLASCLSKWNPKKLLLLVSIFFLLFLEFQKADNTDSGNTLEPPEFPGKDTFSIDTEALYPVMAELRVIKTDRELEVLRYANKIGSEAHLAAMKHIRAGHYEFQMER